MGMLSILKIVGISVLVLLLMLLVLLVLCLFVPFRYRIYGKMPKKGQLPAGDQVRLSVSVSLLLFFFRLSYEYSPEGKKKDVRIFGLPVSFFWSRKRKKRQKMPENIDGQNSTELEENDFARDSGLWEQTGEPDVFSEDGRKDVSDSEKQDGASDGKQEVLKASEDLERPGEIEADRKSYGKTAGWQKGKDIFRSLGSFPEKARDFFCGFRQFLDKIKRMGGDLQQMQKEISDVWKNVHVRNGVFFAWRKLRQFLKHMRPRRVEGRLHFGFSDPAVTGQLLGAFSMVYAFYGDAIQIEPDFEQSAFDGEIRIRGRFQLFSMLWMAWTLYRNREVRYAMKRIRGIGQGQRRKDS